MSPELTLEFPTDRHLLIARWTGPGIEEDFSHESREILLAADHAGSWRWLLDYRAHGDTTEHNARDLFTTVLSNTKGRFKLGTIPRIAVLVLPGFTVLPSQLPDEAFQARRKYTARLFTDEGAALAWLNEEVGSPGIDSASQA